VDPILITNQNKKTSHSIIDQSLSSISIFNIHPLQLSPPPKKKKEEKKKKKDKGDDPDIDSNPTKKANKINISLTF
jgi:hypothetical protein